MPAAKTPRLNGRDGEVWHRYIRGETQAAIAAEYRISQQRVSQILGEVRDEVGPADRAAEALKAAEALVQLKGPLFAAALGGDLAATRAYLAADKRHGEVVGFDSPKEIGVALAHRTELEGAAVADAVSAVVGLYDDALSSACADAVWARAVREAALVAAQWALTGQEGARPMLPAGPAAEAPPVVVKSLPAPPAWLEPGLTREEALKLLQLDVERWEEAHGKL